MQNLIIRKGFNKRAAVEDGPSFEQQFGILANAVIADKLPLMDNMKIAFQLIDKNEDNTEACGASVYLVGRNVVFVPAFFKNNKLKTGDMMFVANSQQFLPLSDPWIAWLKNKDLQEVGALVPEELMAGTPSAKGTTIRDIADPIIKTASVYLKGLLRTDPELTRRIDGASILDTSLALGKTATASMLDNLVKDTNFLNATLTFYSGEELDRFAKRASALEDEAPEVELILPFDKEAKTLTDQELHALHKDGFFIRKTASKEVPDVIRTKQLNGMFSAVSEIGKAQMLQPDGEIKEAVILSLCDEPCKLFDNYMGWGCSANKHKDLNAVAFIQNHAEYDRCLPRHGFAAVSGDTVTVLPADAMKLSAPGDTFSADMLSGIGAELTDSYDRDIQGTSYLVFPEGSIASVKGWCEWRKNKDGKGWTADNIIITIAENDDLKRPLATASNLVLPKGTRIIRGKDNGSGSCRIGGEPQQAGLTVVTMSTLEPCVTAYCNKRYNKAKVYSNGQEYVITGTKSEDEKPMSLKEAAMALVMDYNMEPAIAKVLLKEASNGTSYDNPRATTYYVTKTAADLEYEDANIGMTTVRNQDPRVEHQTMPTVLEDPAQLQQAINTAAQQGIKEVFDVTALKLLVRQNRFFDEIADDIPLLMRVLDSLCRKLFQFYWHTDKMEEKYGTIKLKALEESLKVALDSLSELTIFFKLRSVDGSGTTRDAAGDLMSGRML